MGRVLFSWSGGCWTDGAGLRWVGRDGINRDRVEYDRVGDAEEARLPRDGLAQRLLAHLVIGITRGAEIDFLGRVEPPQLAMVGQGLSRLVEIPRIPVL